ncbi:MAG: response regulator [Endomicrobia bacterium]|nr:response regulator [Endomicrobiia bacterium]
MHTKKNCLNNEKNVCDSMAALKSILNEIDVYIYVSDSETDKILFINDKLRSRLGIGESEGIGSVCWKVIYGEAKEKCSFCPVFTLNKTPSSKFVWEEYDAAANKYYKNTDSIIEWIDGRKAHLRYCADITRIKITEKNLEKHIAQQEVMTSLAKIFISSEKRDAQINKALQLAGKFTDVSTIKIYRHDKNKELAEILDLWTAPQSIASEIKIVPFKEGNNLYDAFVTNKEPFVIVEDVEGSGKYPIAAGMGMKSFMACPVTVSEELWGILIFGNFARRQWTESEKQLAKLMSSILSGSVMRINTERLLIKMSMIVENSLNCIACADRNSNFTYVNPAMAGITGYSKEELFEHGTSLINYDGKNAALREEIISKLEKEGSHTFENIIKTKSGEKLSILLSLFFIDDTKTEIGCVGTDLTKQRILENEIIKAKEIAESASMAKGEFLARMSHEIRNPINAIMGMTAIAKSAKDIEKKDYCLKKIDVASAHLLGIINDILDMSKIEANKLELVENEFNLELMIENIVGIVNFLIEQKQQNLIINIDRSVPKSVVGDEMRLNQVLMNLLTNAVKFTPESGTIKLNINKVAREGDIITLKFEVRDNGIGIAKEQQEKLFNHFEQADGSISRQFGGTGLGLAISKRIVELMNGNIYVESKLNDGSSFIFTVQVKKGAKQSELKIAQDINLENMRILAVDDSKEIRNYFIELMSKFAVKCDVASNGTEALKLIKNNKYNIIFIDWMMPVIDGIELTRLIKKDNPQNCIIIMISTVKWSEIENKAADAGVDRFIGKPLLPSALINIINESFSGGVMLNTKTAANNSSVDKKPNYEGKCILVAEDTEINREIIKAFLQNTKVKIDFASNGIEAVDMFKADPDKYGLILMDVQMPKMDGLEATRTIRALDFERAKTVPVIALTANVFNEDIQECLAAGMNSHIGKPIDMNSMFVTLKKYMPETDSSEETESLKGEKSGNAYFLPYINIEEGLGRLINDKKLYFKLLNSFDGKKIANELIENINSGNFKASAVTAHTIKGIAANLGLIALWELSKEIEMKAKEEQSLLAYVDNITKITEKTLKLIAELTKN